MVHCGWNLFDAIGLNDSSEREMHLQRHSNTQVSGVSISIEVISWNENVSDFNEPHPICIHTSVDISILPIWCDDQMTVGSDGRFIGALNIWCHVSSFSIGVSGLLYHVDALLSLYFDSELKYKGLGLGWSLISFFFLYFKILILLFNIIELMIPRRWNN